MPTYENSVFPYSVHSTVNLPAWRPKDANDTLMSFLRIKDKELHDKGPKIYTNFI